MNGRVRLFLCGACVAIGAFHAPWATHVFAEDVTGTYAFVVRAERSRPDGPRESVVRAEKNKRGADAARGDEFRIESTALGR